MACIVPTCGIKSAGSLRPFPRHSALSARWADSIQQGCGLQMNLDDVDPNERQICIWHFDTPGTAASFCGDKGEYLEPKWFIDSDGNQVETDCCRLCLRFSTCNDMVNMNGKIDDGLTIQSMISDVLEIESQGTTLICTECFVRLELLRSIRKEFQVAQMQFQHLVELVQKSVTQDVPEVDVKTQDPQNHKVDVDKRSEGQPESSQGNDSRCGEVEEDSVEGHSEQAGEQSSNRDGSVPRDRNKAVVPNRKRRRAPPTGPPNKQIRTVSDRKCYICPTILIDKSALAVHLENEHSCDSVTKKCEKCSLDFDTIPSYNTHLSRHDNSTSSRMKMLFYRDTIAETSVNESGSLACKVCGKSYKAIEALRFHFRGKHTDNKYSCHICRAVFQTNSVLERHLLTHTGEKPHKCDQCNDSFNRKQLLRQHKLKFHDANNPFVCNLCQQEFEDYYEMYKHKHLVHLGTNKFNDFACKLCQEKTSDSAELQAHIDAYHTGESYPYLQCPECPRTFVTSDLCNVHKRSHTRKFKCEQCEKIFRTSSVLQAHMENVHSGETSRHECPICPNKSFKTRQSYLVHKNRMHGNQKYECEFCQKQFNRKDNLDIHRRLHTGAKPYGCGKCPMRFADPRAAYKHRKRCSGQKDLS